jgi:hypothetical protein
MYINMPPPLYIVFMLSLKYNEDILLSFIDIIDNKYTVFGISPIAATIGLEN